MALKKNLVLMAVTLVLFTFGVSSIGAPGSTNNQGITHGASRIPLSANPRPDPQHQGLVLKNFGSHPLFGSQGPGKDDVLQGGAGDCYFLSELAALADAHPEFIRKTVSDLGDGTYLVHFVRGRQPANVRVDANLWVDSSGEPKYAGFGANGPIWAAIIEKAFATCRRPPFNYASIAGGNGEALCRLAATEDVLHRDKGVDPQDVVDWFKNGAPNGPIRDAVISDAHQLLLWMRAKRDAGKAVIVGSYHNISDKTQLRPPSAKGESTYRRGVHIYMVDQVVSDQQGNPFGLVLRDPFGKYRTLRDLIRICFCISDPAAIDIDPGFLP